MLYIMRHGKTDWNAEHKLQGRTDIPLNDEGRAMAENAGIMYRDIHIDVCYCSPLVRARETAEILLKGRNVPIITDKRLAEMSFGVCEGMKNYFEVKDNSISPLFSQPEKYVTPVENGESFEELYARTGEFIREVIEPQLKDRDILIVGHGAMNNSIICQLKDISLENFWSIGIENCKLIRLK
ncbi:MAG: histidine phosphatase family protein [Ruminococcus flavefaciens]|nr:histidine phosphatase family protein [Ruminococcus flavefaciens]